MVKRGLLIISREVNCPVDFLLRSEVRYGSSLLRWTVRSVVQCSAGVERVLSSYFIVDQPRVHVMEHQKHSSQTPVNPRAVGHFGCSQGIPNKADAGKP